MSTTDLIKVNLMAHLPKEIYDSLTCFTFVNYKVFEGAPDIVTCNTNGYMYEIQRKKIERCLNLYERAKTVSCYYVSEKKNLIIFYLIITSSQRFLIVRRTDKYLKLVKAYDGVREFEVFDFQCVGFPQILITFIDETETCVCDFPVESPIEEKCSELGNSIAESLIEELQLLNKHLDDLSEEYEQLKKICFSNGPYKDLEKISVGTVAFSSFLNESIQQKLKVCDKWYNVYGGKLILGIKLHNVSNIILHDIEFMIDHTAVKDYSYRFFQALNDISDYLILPSEISRSVKPGEEIYVVVPASAWIGNHRRNVARAFQVPEFTVESEFSASCCVTSSNLKERLAKENFRLTAYNIASKTNTGIEERFSVEDFMSIAAVQHETRVNVKTDGPGNGALESAMVDDLGFVKIKNLKDKLFYCTSTYLKEVFVAMRPHETNPRVSSMIIWTGESTQICFLINALYDLLPDNSSVLCDENWR